MKKEFIDKSMYKPRFEKDNCGVGLILDKKGKKSHKLIVDGIKMLENMEHRGAVGYDNKTGDGAGIKIEIPHYFFSEILDKNLPKVGHYAVGMFFFPMEPNLRFKCMALIENLLKEKGFNLIAWRNVPINTKNSGSYARNTLPEIQQLFIEHENKDENLEKKLFILRKEIEEEIYSIKNDRIDDFYICSLSSNSIIYKGLLLAKQIRKFYCDLKNSKVKSSYIIVHQRYSTNTSPRWALAHPFRYIAHNGEINTINGNVKKFKKNISNCYNNKNLLPKKEYILEKNASDSLKLDNVIELLKNNNRSIIHCLAMLIPEAYKENKKLSDEQKYFYEYNEEIMDPWDGPANILFSDNEYIGAKCDRNGLRPSRYYVTNKNKIIIASEAGVLPIESSEILKRGKVKPGEFFVFDRINKKIMNHIDVLNEIISSDYQKIMKENILKLNCKDEKEIFLSRDLMNKYLTVFGYFENEVLEDIKYMGYFKKEVITSMGGKKVLSCLSKKPEVLFDYFKQLFAQVTNPAIDPIREKNVMSLNVSINNFKGLLGGINKENHSYYLPFEHPILTNEQLIDLQYFEKKNFKSIKIPLVYNGDDFEKGLEKGLEILKNRVKKAIESGYDIIILSDKIIDKFSCPIPSLLGLSYVNTSVARSEKVYFIVEAADIRQSMDISLLLGYGATLVNPYLMFNVLKYESIDKKVSYKELEDNLIKSLKKGLLKILSKMGISTIRSYIDSQLFETIGFSNKLSKKYFNNTVNNLEGINLKILSKEVFMRHEKAFFGAEYLSDSNSVDKSLTSAQVELLQLACEKNSYKLYKEFSDSLNEETNIKYIRDLFKIKKSENTEISIDSIESVESIMKKMVIGAMSFGSISKEAHECLAEAMNKIGGKSNSGEGGEELSRYSTQKRSKIKQVAAGRFGVTVEYLNDADEIQIKIAQGAKPGEGGHLPSKKVTHKISEIRHSMPNIPLISPPPHHDIYSIEDLEQLIHDLTLANPDALISVKLVSRSGIGTIASGVVKGHADKILISGYDGGTGAALKNSINYAGIPWELGLIETHHTLLLNNLRKNVTLRVDGQMRTGRDVVIAALLGAEEFGFSTMPLVSLGCLMKGLCHTNKCPKGIATQNSELRKKFKGKSEYIINYFRFVAKEVREYLLNIGVRSLDELLGKNNYLEKKNINNWKLKLINISKILYDPIIPQNFTRESINRSKKEIITSKIDNEMIELLSQNSRENIKLSNQDRSVGAALSSYLTKNFKEEKKYEPFYFHGTAGQSFGAFLKKGLIFRLDGDGNDYVGKGLSGGKISIFNSKNYGERDVLIGNTALYGATSGYLYINGCAGERFAVRNSGAISVVEGVGNHGCEYMTNGIVIVLGSIGENFAAGMTGGIVYLFNKKLENKKFINQSSVKLSNLSEEDKEVLKKILKDFFKETRSLKAKKIISQWNYYSNLFLKITNKKYESVVEKEGISNVVKTINNIV